jgi:TonB family protein
MNENNFLRFYIKHAFVIALLFPFSCWAQKIITDEQDNNSNQRKIELSPLKLVSTSKAKMNFSIGSIGPSIYLRLSGTGTGAEIVNVGDKVIFHLDNDSTVTVQSESLQTYDVEGITSTYNHSYNLSLDGLKKLSSYNLKKLRKYHAEEFDDIVIPNQSGKQVKNFSKFLFEELKKRNLVQPDTLLIAKKKAPSDSLRKTAQEDTSPQLKSSSAAFPGGEDVWVNFLKRNLHPPSELKANEKKVVQVQFIVNEDGSIKEVEIVQSAGPSFDKEVIRVLKRMPYWKPAVENGRRVNTLITKSITFIRDDASAGLSK